ncbi:Signal recognition particle SEC65 subunit [Dictyocoela muelleri]|nr:Signal recognition particle SEC65 subunit [Dictyocoela muelleri]
MEDYFMIYPVHLDLKLKKSEGRKYKKELCVEKPQISEIKKVLDDLELEYQLEDKKRHPRSPFTWGRVKVPKMYGKANIIQSIATGIKELRLKKEESKQNELKQNESKVINKDEKRDKENKTSGKKLVARKKVNKKKK